MRRSLYNLQGKVDEIRSGYSGSLVIADDLDCINF